MTTKTMYFGGIPTDVDVRALLERFSDPVEGTPITYTEVEETIHVARGSRRYATVTTRWRRRLWAERQIFIGARDGAFWRLNPSEELEHCHGKMRHVARVTLRTHRHAGLIDRGRLSSEEKKQADHIMLTAAAVTQAARLQARREGPSLPAAVGAK